MDVPSRTTKRKRPILSEAQKVRRNEQERRRYHLKKQQQTIINSSVSNHNIRSPEMGVQRKDKMRTLSCISEEQDKNIDEHTDGHTEIDETINECHYLGLPTMVCSKCSAIVWKEERIKSKNKGALSFSLCCKDGRVSLPLLKQSPLFLHLMLDPQNCSKQAKHFRENIRLYNSLFAFTSLGAKIDYTVLDGRGPYTFRIHGQNYHRIGSLLPFEGNKPQYAQLYIYDTDHETQNRVVSLNAYGLDSKSDINMIGAIKNMLDDTNIYVKEFRRVRDWYSIHKCDDFGLRILENRETNGIQYNAPAVNEIAALMIGSDLEEKYTRDVIICAKKKGFQRIDETHPSYMPLQYPLLFPFGEDGWHRYLKRNQINHSNSMRLSLTMKDFYAYRLQQRELEGTTLLRSGRLFQQYIVDAYTAIEEYRLRWLRSNQKHLRCELYRGLHDALEANDTDINLLGKKIILPSTFTGGPRYMVQNYQDAMAICAWAGPPDLFITFTCNPKWPEIQEFLESVGGQDAQDRPDIVARIFHMKLNSLLDDLIKNKIFGRLVADLSVVEFQKRGLPHCHILITFDSNSKINSPLKIDEFVQAELPDKSEEPVLYELVLTHMIHGPCGVYNPKCPCMKNECCSKKYPKKFNDYTATDDRGYPIYRRRSNSPSTTIKDHTVDSSWIVPYNPRLLLRYQCHLNVEVCNQKKAIKYLFKYISKGSDHATAVIESNKEYKYDEIKRYLDSRYIAASEACWRIFEFKIHRRFPPVERLQYHLLGEHLIFFQQDKPADQILNSDQLSKTMLTEWFVANTIYPHARDLAYIEFPTQFVWNKKCKKWTPRKRGFSIGRLPYASPATGERYFLRLLLGKVKGATSFAALRTINNSTYDTYRGACVALGLLDDDNEWNLALIEASVWATASQLRYMFVTILLFCEVLEPRKIWESHWESMSDDYQKWFDKNHSNFNITFTDRELQNKALIDIEAILNENNRTLKDFAGMPYPVEDSSAEMDNRLIIEELNYNSNSQTIQIMHEYIKDRAILACRNEEADEINDYVLNIQNNQTKCYLSADTRVSLAHESSDDYLSYPVEFLNSLTVSGIPNHKLSLKVNAPIMLLRNINPSIGLCNGTRLIISKLGDRVIEAEIITGSHIGKRVAIPRIIMTLEKADLPFILKRRQFPVRLSYAMTINKSQGQSLTHIGLYLRTPVFTHGQLYVALSRAKSPKYLKILLEPQTDVPYNYTKNIVYKEVLQSIFEKTQNH